ncbi:MAG: tyrosine-type recombinase/integrase [bacterium]|nr:tyrosine-type recombinase/integrase [bacterium]
MGGARTFADYLSDLRGRSARTVEEYVRDVAAFEGWCTGRGFGAEPGLTRVKVGLFLMDRMAAGDKAGSGGGLSPRSAARLVSALKAYGQYLVFCGKLEAGQIEDLRPPRYSRTLPAYFNADEIRAIVCAFDADLTPRGIRNAAILHLLYAAGLRVSENAGLRLSSVRLGERIVTVFGKGSRERAVPYGERAANALTRYIEAARMQLVSDKSADWLWLNVRGGKLTARAMRTILDQAALRAGSIKPISPHKLRHACATHMLEGGADVRLLQELLGHQSINTTQVYTQITRTKLLEAYEKTHPRAAK